MVLLIIIPFLNGYLFGKINPIFRQTHMAFFENRLPKFHAKNLITFPIEIAKFFWGNDSHQTQPNTILLGGDWNIGLVWDNDG